MQLGKVKYPGALLLDTIFWPLSAKDPFQKNQFFFLVSFGCSPRVS